MPTEPDWLVAVREWRKAELAAMNAIDNAFPRGSHWMIEGVEVIVTGADGERIGNVWVNLDVPPYWQKSVYCCALKPIEVTNGTREDADHRGPVSQS